MRVGVADVKLTFYLGGDYKVYACLWCTIHCDHRLVVMCIFQFTLSIVNRSDMTVSLEDSKIKKRTLSSLKDCCTKSDVHQRLGCIHEPLFDIELDHVKQQDSDIRILIPFPFFYTNIKFL